MDKLVMTTRSAVDGQPLLKRSRLSSSTSPTSVEPLQQSRPATASSSSAPSASPATKLTPNEKFAARFHQRAVDKITEFHDQLSYDLLNNAVVTVTDKYKQDVERALTQISAALYAVLTHAATSLVTDLSRVHTAALRKSINDVTGVKHAASVIPSLPTLVDQFKRIIEKYSNAQSRIRVPKPSQTTLISAKDIDMSAVTPDRSLDSLKGVLQYLDVFDLLHLRAVNKPWRQLVDSSSAWKAPLVISCADITSMPKADGDGVRQDQAKRKVLVMARFERYLNLPPASLPLIQSIVIDERGFQLACQRPQTTRLLYALRQACPLVQRIAMVRASYELNGPEMRALAMFPALTSLWHHTVWADCHMDATSLPVKKVMQFEEFEASEQQAWERLRAQCSDVFQVTCKGDIGAAQAIEFEVHSALISRSVVQRP